MLILTTLILPAGAAALLAWIVIVAADRHAARRARHAEIRTQIAELRRRQAAEDFLPARDLPALPQPVWETTRPRRRVVIFDGRSRDRDTAT